MCYSRPVPRRILLSNAILAITLAFIVCYGLTATAQNYQNDINATSNWMASSAVTLSDGAVVDGANSTRINPYFANLGVTGFAKDSTYYNNIQNYMEWYWNHVSWPRQFNVVGCTVNPSNGALYGAINDFDVGSGGVETAVPDPDAQGNHHPDSTDAYAGTFLSMAYAYWQTGDANAQAYIKNITIGANGDRLDYVGEVVIATKQSQANNLTCARPDYNIQYLMDNSEAYRGLRDLQNLYTALGATTKAQFYQAHADQMQSGILTYLWNSSANDFYWYTTVSGGSGTVNWSTWYPDSVSQVFPIALGVIAPSDPKAQAIWSTFQSHWQSKWTTLTTGDAYPWVIVGYAAALMGDTADANTFIKNIETKYVNTNFTGGAWSVNEAGYFIRMCAYLNGGGTTGSLIPTPPSNATHLANLDDDPITTNSSGNGTTGNWGWCTTSDCSPTPPAQFSLTHTSTSQDGNALDAYDSGNAYWGALYYHKNGAQDSATHYEVQWTFMLNTSWSNVQATEFDFPASIAGLWFYFGSQCNSTDGKWDYWDPNSATHGWHATNVACPGFSANAWHTITWYGTRTNNAFTYSAIAIDGQQYAVNITLNAPSTTWGDDFIVQFQPDGRSSGAGYSMYVDEVNAWVW